MKANWGMVYKMKIINFYGLFLIGVLFFVVNASALSRPTGEIARSRASMQQGLQARQNRWSKFAAGRQEGSPKIFEQIQSFGCKENEIFLSPQNLPGVGICVNMGMGRLSKLIQGAMDSGIKEIKVPFTLAQMKDGIDLLQEIQTKFEDKDLYQTSDLKIINKGFFDELIKLKKIDSFDRLINATNVADYLQCQFDITKTFLPAIKILMDNGKQDIVKSAAFHQLSRDYQELLISDSTEVLLKQAIMKKNNQQFLINIDQKAEVSSDGEKIVFVDKNNRQHLRILCNLTRKDPVRATIKSALPYTCATISPDGSTIIATTSAFIEQLKTDNLDEAESIQFEKNETITSLVCDHNGSVVVFSKESGDIIKLIFGDDQNFNVTQLFSGEKNISKVILSADGNKIVAIGDNKIFVLNSGYWRTVRYSSSIKGIVMNPGTANFILWKASVRDPNDDVIQKFDFDPTGKPLEDTIGCQKGILAAAQSYDDKYVASLGEGGLILWDRKDGTMLFKGLSGLSASLVAFSHDGKNLLLYSNRDSKLICFSISKLIESNNTIEPIIPEFTIAKIGKEMATYTSLSLSDDDRKIILSGDTTLVGTLATDAQVSMISKIKSECTIEQRRLIYQLAWDFAHNTPMQLDEDSAEFALFKTLPGGIQDALFDLIGIHEVQGFGPANPSWQHKLWQLRQSLKSFLTQ